MLKRIINTKLVASLLVLALGSALAQDAFDIAVHFPGELGGNPLELPIAAGVERVDADFDNVNIRIIEGGPASDWESSIIALAATGQYELIITFTDGMPQILETVSVLFPDQKFALLDSQAPELANVYSLVYSDEALGFLGGAFGVEGNQPLQHRFLKAPLRFFATTTRCRRQIAVGDLQDRH